MKFIALAFTLFILHCAASAQVLVESSSVERAKFLKQADQLPANAIFLQATGHLVQVAMAPESHILYALVRDEKKGKTSKKGQLVAYNLKSQKEIWTVIFEEKEANIALHGTMPIMIFDGHSEAYSPTDGTTIWRNAMRIRKILTCQGLAIAADRDPGIGKVQGFDLETGEEKWLYTSRYLKDLDNFSVSGDTIATFVWPDFHQIDLRSGEGFFLDLKIGNTFSRESEMLIGFMFGFIGLAVLYSVTTPAYGIVVGSDLNRNLIYGGVTYDASTNLIIAIEPPGEFLWAFGQRDGFVGIPKILEHKGAIYAVFPGYLRTREGYFDGHAAAIKIDPKNGAVLASTFLSDSKSQFVTDFALYGDTMLVVMNNKMISLNMDGLEIIKSNQFGDVNFGSGLDRIVTPPYYTLSENRIIRESESKLEKLYVQNTSGLKIEISEMFEPVAVVPKTRFFGFAGNIGSYSAYANEYRVVIADENDNLLPYEFSTNFQMNGSYIWDWNTKNLVVVPVEGMLFKQ